MSANNRHEDAPAPTITLPSISYTILQSGDPNGQRPRRWDTITVHYEVSTDDGAVLDSSQQRGAPSVFSLAKLITAWQVVLPLMAPGDEWRVTVPPEFAYGATGKPPVAPNSTLIFQIALIAVEPAEPD